jgi:hypothetical protein
VHCAAAAQVTANANPAPESIVAELADMAPPVPAGSKVHSLVWLIAVHWLVEMHVTATRPKSSPGSSDAVTGEEGAVGSNTTTLPEPSTSTHWPADGHETASASAELDADATAASTVWNVSVAGGELGLKVASPPRWSISVHCVVEAQARSVSGAGAVIWTRVA